MSAGHVTFRTPTRRGLTMLEVVLASVLMAMIATTLVAGLGYVHAAHRRQQMMLGAAEVANRIVLQYLDDKDSLPSNSLPVAYGANGQMRYFWKLDRDRVELKAARPGAGSQATRTSGVSADRLDMITVRVWHEEIQNVNPSLSGMPDDYALRRIIDPIAVRNPDSIAKQFSSPEKLAEWLQQFSNLQGAD